MCTQPITVGDMIIAKVVLFPGVVLQLMNVVGDGGLWMEGKGGGWARVKSYNTRARALTGLLGNGNGKGGGGKEWERARWKPDPGRRPVRCALRPCLGRFGVDVIVGEAANAFTRLHTPSRAFSTLLTFPFSSMAYGWDSY